MKRLLFFLSFIGIISHAQAQKTKTVTKVRFMAIETFDVLKSQKKVRHGDFLSINRYTKTPIAKGQYANNNRIGVWEFYDYRSGELEQKFDFDNHILLFSNLENTPSNHFKYNEEWILDQLDTVPLHIGGFSEVRMKLTEKASDLITPPDIPVAGMAVFSFIVTKQGETKDFKIVLSSGNDFEDELLTTLMDFKENWIPGVYKGEKVDVEYLIPMNIAIKENSLHVKAYSINFNHIRSKLGNQK